MVCPRSEKITIYHGTLSTHRESFEREEVRIPARRDKIRDFGNGSYATLRRRQAMHFARDRVFFTKHNPMFVVCGIDVGALRDLEHRLVLENDRGVS